MFIRILSKYLLCEVCGQASNGRTPSEQKSRRKSELHKGERVDPSPAVE